MQVNAETLQERIKYLELCKLTPVLGISINEAYQLEAYRMLLEYMLEDMRNCHCDYTVNENRRECLYCGKLL